MSPARGQAPVPDIDGPGQAPTPEPGCNGRSKGSCPGAGVQRSEQGFSLAHSLRWNALTSHIHSGHTTRARRAGPVCRLCHRTQRPRHPAGHGRGRRRQLPGCGRRDFWNRRGLDAGFRGLRDAAQDGWRSGVRGVCGGSSARGSSAGSFSPLAAAFGGGGVRSVIPVRVGSSVPVYPFVRHCPVVGIVRSAAVHAYGVRRSASGVRLRRVAVGVRRSAFGAWRVALPIKEGACCHREPESCSGWSSRSR